MDHTDSSLSISGECADVGRAGWATPHNPKRQPRPVKLRSVVGWLGHALSRSRWRLTSRTPNGTFDPPRPSERHEACEGTHTGRNRCPAADGLVERVRSHPG